MIGVLVIRRGRQHLAPSAAEVLAHDQRQPVVYLRSFRADKLMSHRPVTFWTDWFSAKTLSVEENLVETLQAEGPVVALGEPGEKVPRLGAARDYVNDELWKGHVIGWLRRAKLVVLLVGETEAFFWEVEQVAGLEDYSPLKFILPNDLGMYTRFRNHAGQYMNTSLPETCSGMAGSLGDVHDRFRRIWGILEFDLGGSWRVRAARFGGGQVNNQLAWWDLFQLPNPHPPKPKKARQRRSK